MKFSGRVGFVLGSKETKPGIYRSVIEERTYKGDIYQNNRIHNSSSEKQNDDLKLSNRIAIVSDLYAQNNWSSIQYIVWRGVRWDVTRINVEFPRIILDIGGVYHGPEPAKETTA